MRHSLRIVVFSAISLFLSGGLLITADAHEAKTHIITITDSGFEPPMLEIIQGDTVSFVNKAARSRWPASNIHPTHEIYPEFDPKRPVPSGETWSFSFTKAGEWKFHDHIFPAQGGTISVKADSDKVPAADLPQPPKKTFKEKISAIVAEFAEVIARIYYSLFPKKANDALASLNMLEVARDEQQLAHWLALLGPEKVMWDILADSDNGSSVDCHQEAHRVGRIGYELFGSSIFEKGDASCHSGFYHGAMESFLKQNGTANLAKNIDGICDLFPTRFGIFECLHGVGHGLLAYENYDMPSALEACKKLRDDFSRQSCYGGVFMENIVTAQGIGAIPGHVTEWVSDDPHFPCNKIDKNYDIQLQCYQMQTSWMLTIFKNDFPKAARECLRAPESMIPICFSSLGRDAAGNTLRDPERISAICNAVPGKERYLNDCIRGALNVIVDFWGGALKHQASELCRIIPEENKRSCYAVLAMRLSDIFANKKEKDDICAAFENNYRDICGTI